MWVIFSVRILLWVRYSWERTPLLAGILYTPEMNGLRYSSQESDCRSVQPMIETYDC